MTLHTRRQPQQPRKRAMQVDIEALALSARLQHDLLDQPAERFTRLGHIGLAPQPLDQRAHAVAIGLGHLRVEP
ncbi:hypothetical protein [Roseinatronobacter bogoriensis]|uniref:hypothetical protein n=1 Tax=Roseinatronobacter bogoriensis TaxID=119542 RepID=UPI0008F91760|nr:hypothetical protein [Rhodobaca bogoriensis]